MTTLPSIEAILLEALQSLGPVSEKTSKPYQTSKKKKFTDGQMRLQEHREMGREVLHAIFETLGMDLKARADCLTNFEEFAAAYKYVELNTWTFDADNRQVLWMLLGNFYIPGLARFVAKWSMGGNLDPNMPGGQFWYLPRRRVQDGKTSLYLPVAQVVDWLLDLLGISVEAFADKLSEATGVERDSIRRDLYNWRKDMVPSLPSISKYFADDVELQFKGTFSPNEHWPPDERLAAAMRFVSQKKLTAETLRLEIPMTAPGRLKAVLEGQASDEEKANFVRLLAARYAPPTPQTIRHYLRIARAVQDGYVRLLKVLFPEVEPLCADPGINKLLQAFDLYELVYNLTIEAWRQHGSDGQEAEDKWFWEQVPPHLAWGPLLSVLPFDQKANISKLAEILKRHFLEAKEGVALEDLMPLDGQSFFEIASRNLNRIDAVDDERVAATELTERLRSTRPLVNLQAENRFRVLLQTVQRGDTSERLRTAANVRLHELAQMPAEKMQTMLVELDHHLTQESKFRGKKTKDRVEALLDTAEASPDLEAWKAPILHYRAKHLLAQNDFNGALKLFREALNACKTRSFGRLHGEIAQDCFALELADQRLIHNNHEVYFRGMLRGDIWQTVEIPKIEDAARKAFDHFWKTLYKPYFEFETRQPRSDKEDLELVEKFSDFLIHGDRDAFISWVKDHSSYLDVPLRSVEGNTGLMNLIKLRTATMKDPRIASSDLLNRMHEYLGLLLLHGPARQVNHADLKAQTPLMLFAEAGDVDLVRLSLSRGANPDMQDYEGRTALHAAVKSRVAACVDALLDHPCRTDLLTIGDQSSLHTAAWCGNVHAARRLVQLAPRLAWRKDMRGFTPLELAEFLIEVMEDPVERTLLLREHGQTVGTERNLEETLEVLENAPIPEL